MDLTGGHTRGGDLHQGTLLAVTGVLDGLGGDLDLGLARGAGRRGELLVVEVQRRVLQGAEELTHSLHHRWRAAEVDVGVLVRLVLTGQVCRDVPLALVVRCLIGDDRDVVEVLDLVLEGVDAVELHQVVIEGGAVDHADRDVEKLIGGELLQDGQDRGQAGAAGEQQDRTDRLAQEERTHGAGEFQLVADGSLLIQVGGHETTRGVLDEEADLVIRGGGGEGVGTGLPGPGDLDVHVLTRQEGQIRTVLQLNGDAEGGIGQAVQLNQLTGEGGSTCLCQNRGCGDLEDQISAGEHLTGQAVPLISLVLRESILNVVALFVVAGLAERLAGSAGAIATVEGNVDAGLVGGIGNSLLVLAFDEAGDSVFESQCNLVGHGVAPRRGKYR